MKINHWPLLQQATDLFEVQFADRASFEQRNKVNSILSTLS